MYKGFGCGWFGCVFDMELVLVVIIVNSLHVLDLVVNIIQQRVHAPFPFAVFHCIITVI